MSWLALLRLVLSLAQSLTSYLNNKRLIDAGEAKAIARQLESSLNAVERASTARAGAVDAFGKRDGVPDDEDPNLRD